MLYDCYNNLGGLVRAVDFHLPVESIVQEEVVGHAHSVRLHGVALPIVVIANVTWLTKIITKFN
jgi:hypothetical protein